MDCEHRAGLSFDGTHVTIRVAATAVHMTHKSSLIIGERITAGICTTTGIAGIHGRAIHPRFVGLCRTAVCAQRCQLGILAVDIPHCRPRARVIVYGAQGCVLDQVISIRMQRRHRSAIGAVGASGIVGDDGVFEEELALVVDPTSVATITTRLVFNDRDVRQLYRTLVIVHTTAVAAVVPRSSATCLARPVAADGAVDHDEGATIALQSATVASVTIAAAPAVSTVPGDVPADGAVLQESRRFIVDDGSATAPLSAVDTPLAAVTGPVPGECALKDREAAPLIDNSSSPAAAPTVLIACCPIASLILDKRSSGNLEGSLKEVNSSTPAATATVTLEIVPAITRVVADEGAVLQRDESVLNVDRPAVAAARPCYVMSAVVIGERTVVEHRVVRFNL